MALKAMRELPDYVMAPGSPDVEGWQVHDRNDHVAGTVIDLLVDTHGDLVRYLVVQLGDGKAVLVPLGDLDLDEDMGVIRLLQHARSDLEALPAYTPPGLSQELERRYYVLFRREEPVGAADMSPLDYRLPPFRVQAERTDRLMRSPRRRQQLTESHSAPVAPPDPPREKAEQRPEAEERSGLGSDPIKGLPGVGAGIFVSNEPWDIANLPVDKASRRQGDLERLGPNAQEEALWQSEQPGVPSALGFERELPEEKYHPE